MNSNKKYKISVIIPVYNADQYLEKCIKSVLNQTICSLELIIVNDGSTDYSLEIIEKFEKENDNIKVISQENTGVVGARITGYKNATGEYIGWVDADDFIERNMYETLYGMAKEKDADIAMCNYKFYPFNPTKKAKWYKDYKGKVDYKFLERNSLQWNKIVKKELLDKVDIINLFEKIGESAYTMVILNTNKIVTINEELYNYRVGHASLSTSYTNCEWYER